MEISKKKPAYPIEEGLRKYLIKYKRAVKIPLTYDDMLRWTDSSAVYDNTGKDTLWESVIYDRISQEEILNALRKIRFS